MAIFKARIESNFATIPNSSLQDENLSYEATGLLAMMLSLPEDWEIHKTWLQNKKRKCGRDKLSSIMKELVDAGYVRKKIKQDEQGRLDGVDWLVYSEPAVLLENRKTVKPFDGKPVTTKEIDLKKEIGNKEKPIKRFKVPSSEEVFEYMTERGHMSSLEAEKFHDYYESNGWVVGRKKMKCWKASVRNWLRNAKPIKNSPHNQQQVFTAEQEADRKMKADAEFAAMFNQMGNKK